MKRYYKEGVLFAVRDFFKQNKAQLLGAAGAFLCGFVLAIAIDSGYDDAEKTISKWKTIVWFLLTLVVCYAMFISSVFTRYLTVLAVGAFIYLGYRAGFAAEFLIVVAGVSGFFNLILIYLPCFIVTFLFANVFIAFNIPYLSASPNSKKIPNCPSGYKTIFTRFLSIFTINTVFVIVWINVFAMFTDVLFVGRA